MSEVRMYDSFEKMLEDIEQNTQAAIASMTDEQRSLCDGQEHYAFYLDSADGSLAVVHVLSLQQILDGKYPDEADLWFDDEGKASRGYLPCRTWDSEYYVWPDEPDLHDRHASILMECTKEEFEHMRENKCLFAPLLNDRHYVHLLNRYVAFLHAKFRKERDARA